LKALHRARLNMVLIRHTNAGFRGNPPDEFCYNVVDIGSVSESFAEE
jgi:hypothetical protein